LQRQGPNFVTHENLAEKIDEALENPVVFEYALDLEGKKIPSPTPPKYVEGVPTKQMGRMYDQSGFIDHSRGPMRRAAASKSA